MHNQWDSTRILPLEISFSSGEKSPVTGVTQAFFLLGCRSTLPESAILSSQFSLKS